MEWDALRPLDVVSTRSGITVEIGNTDVFQQADKIIIVHSLFQFTESAVDGNLVKRVRYPDTKISPKKAIQKYEEELLEVIRKPRDWVDSDG